MKPAVVNAWSRMVLMPAEEGAGNYRWTSTVVLECTCPPIWGFPRSSSSSEAAPELIRKPAAAFRNLRPELPFVAARELHALDISLEGLRCTMAPETVLVSDGLVHSFKVAPSEEHHDSASIRIFLEHPVSPTTTEKSGLPHLIIFEFSREPVRKVFRGKSVVIDPGHGGRDKGFRGPVNLLEKNVATVVSKNLYSLLSLAGARPYLTRRDDVAVEEFARVQAAINRHADCLIKVHASGDDDPDRRAYFVRYPPRSEASRTLALEIRNALLERMGIDAALVEWDELDGVPIPVVQVEPLCLTHYSDEANFRAPLFQKRLAQSIFNGLMRWYLEKG